MNGCSHFPQGKCGLKLELIEAESKEEASLPLGEVWIEISINKDVRGMRAGHFPQGKCGLKSIQSPPQPLLFPSLPSGEVWIEIF